jgi:hypothetical protein
MLGHWHVPVVPSRILAKGWEVDPSLLLDTDRKSRMCHPNRLSDLTSRCFQGLRPSWIGHYWISQEQFELEHSNLVWLYKWTCIMQLYPGFENPRWPPAAILDFRLLSCTHLSQRLLGLLLKMIFLNVYSIPGLITSISEFRDEKVVQDCNPYFYVSL